MTRNVTLLLVDSDLFCKLGVVGLLEPLLALFEVDLAECGRLPALPHMLRRGQFPKKYGPSACEALVATAEAMAVAPAASSEWLERVTGIPRIDVGEALLYATAAQHSLTIMTGDKRAMAAIAGVSRFPEALAGRIVCLEAVLLLLCERLGDQHVRSATRPLVAADDKTVKICFSDGNAKPRECLRSYFDSLKREVRPLVLWDLPSTGGT